MKLLLKNGHIYLPVSNNVVIDNATFAIEVLDKIDLTNYNKTVIINGSQHSFTEVFTIAKKELAKQFLDLSITLTHKDTGEALEYKADTYPITRAVVLGRPFNECYPSIVNNIVERLNIIEQKHKLVAADVVSHWDMLKAHAADIEVCEKAIVELKQEGEII